MYKGTSDLSWKCGQNEESFYHAWWTYKKARNFGFQLHIMVQKFFINQWSTKIKTFFCWVNNSQLEKNHGKLCLYKIIAVKLLYGQKWKDSEIHVG